MARTIEDIQADLTRFSHELEALKSSEGTLVSNIADHWDDPKGRGPALAQHSLSWSQAMALEQKLADLNAELAAAERQAKLDQLDAMRADLAGLAGTVEAAQHDADTARDALDAAMLAVNQAMARRATLSEQVRQLEQEVSRE